jgi:hypothetical protein
MPRLGLLRGLGIIHSSHLKTAFLTFAFCIMSFLSTLLRALLVLLVLACAPQAGCAAPAGGAQDPVRPLPGQPTSAAQHLTLQLGPLQLRYYAHPDHPTLLDRLLFGSRVGALARQVASGNGPHLPF